MSKVKVGSTEKLQTVHLILDGRETQSQEVRSSFRFSVRHKGIKKLLTSGIWQNCKKYIDFLRSQTRAV